MKKIQRIARFDRASALLLSSMTFISPSMALADAGFWGALGGLGEAMQDVADDLEYSAREERAYQRQLDLERQQYELERQRLELIRQQRLEADRLEQQRLQQQAEEHRQQADEEYFKNEMAKVVAAHPDALMIASSTAFHNWLLAQPSYVRGWYDSDTAADAIRVLDMFDQFLRDDSVSAIQRGLSGLGYDPGPTDGVLGPQTQKAIEYFERDRGLDVTGAITLELLAIVQH